VSRRAGSALAGTAVAARMGEGLGDRGAAVAEGPAGDGSGGRGVGDQPGVIAVDDETGATFADAWGLGLAASSAGCPAPREPPTATSMMSPIAAAIRAPVRVRRAATSRVLSGRRPLRGRTCGALAAFGMG